MFQQNPYGSTIFEAVEALHREYEQAESPSIAPLRRIVGLLRQRIGALRPPFEAAIDAECLPVDAGSMTTHLNA